MNLSQQELKEKIGQIKELNEDEIMALKQEFKRHELPPWRTYSLLGYNLCVASLVTLYGIHHQQISKQYIRPKKYSFGQMIKYSTVQAIAFVFCYLGGSYLVTGGWNPIVYLKQLSQIDGAVVDTYIKFDPFCQQQFLFNNMKYFGLSEQLIQQAQQELEEQEQQHNKFWTTQESKGLFKVFVQSRQKLKNEYRTQTNSQSDNYNQNNVDCQQGQPQLSIFDQLKNQDNDDDIL